MKQIFRVSVILLLALAMVLTAVSCADDPVETDTTTVGEQGDPDEGSTTEPSDDGTTTTDPSDDGSTTADPTPDDMTELQLVKLVVVAQAANVYAARGDEAAKTTFAEGSILTAEAEDAEWYLVKNEHGDGGFVAKTDVADAAVLDSFEAVAEEVWEVTGMVAVVRSYPSMDASLPGFQQMARGTLQAGTTVTRLAANDTWSRVRAEVVIDGATVTGEYYVMTASIAKVSDNTTTAPNPDGGDTNPPDDGNTTTAPNPDGGDTNPSDDGGDTPAGPHLATDIRLSAAFETLNGVNVWENMAFMSNMSYRRGEGGKASIATLNIHRLDASCRISLTGWALLDGGQDGLYWSVDGTTWTAFTGGQYKPADDALESATNSSGTYLGALTDAKAENGRFADVTADLSAYNGQMINLSVAVRSAVDGNKYVEILKLTNLCVNYDFPEDVKLQNSRTDVRTNACFDTVNGVAIPGMLTVHKPGSFGNTKVYSGLVIEEAKIALSGWALINGGQDGLYWSLDQYVWYPFTGGAYSDADQDVINASTSSGGAELTNAKAANGRFANIEADLSAYAGQTIDVYVAVHGSGFMVNVLTLTNVQVPTVNAAN